MPETEATKVKLANTANCHICVNTIELYTGKRYHVLQISIGGHLFSTKAKWY